MKPVTICLIIYILFLQNVKSQDSLQSGKIQLLKSLMAKMTVPNGQTMEVRLMGIGDSTLIIYQKSSDNTVHHQKTNIYLKSEWESWNYKFIESVKVRNKTLRALVVPAAAVLGMIGGIIIAKNGTYNQNGFEGAGNKGGAYILGFLLGGVVGTLTGVVVCSTIEKKYLINGDWKSFEEMKASLISVH
jgi:hypothetical protein